MRILMSALLALTVGYLALTVILPAFEAVNAAFAQLPR